MEQDKSAKNRRIGLIVTLIINLGIITYIAITEFGREKGASASISAGDIKLWFLLPGVLCFFVAAFMECLKFRRLLMLSEGRLDRKGALECALLGKYYDNVTPMGAGGQPFQIHYLIKRGYSNGTAAASTTVSFLCQQFAFVLIGAVVFLIRNGEMRLTGNALKVTANIGLLLYALLPAILLTFMIIPKPLKAFVHALVKLLGKIHIGRHYLIKNPDEAADKWLNSIDEAVKCVKAYSKHPFVLIKLLMCSVIYQAAILSVPYFMLKAFGGSGDWWTITSYVVYITAAISIIPTPGNTGAAEGSFYAVFSALEGGMLFWAMIAWRAIVYYGWLICGITVIARSAVSNGKSRLKSPPAEGPLKVALFTDLFYPAIDGVVRTVDAYARHINLQGSEAYVVHPKQRTNAEGFPYKVYRTGSIHIPHYLNTVPTGTSTRELRRLFKTDPPDVIHSHSPFFNGRLALRYGRKYHIPVVATFHSKYYDDALNVTHSRLLAKALTAIVVSYYVRADYVWACSLSTARTLRQYGYNGEIMVMENGIELSRVPKDIMERKAEARKAFDIPAHKKLLLFVGQMIWQKDLKLILDALKLLVEKDEDYFLILAGEGYNDEAIRAYAKQQRLGEYTHFVGKVSSYELLYELYANADMLVFPSLYDNAPLVIREAAAAGIPSLLSAGSNAAEGITDGENGYLAEHDAQSIALRIIKAYKDNNLREVGLNAKRTIPIDWSEIVKRALTSYRSGAKQGHNRRLESIFGDGRENE